MFDLRRYAQRIGVKGATEKNKKELIDSIIAVESGEIKPCFSKRGRPKSQSFSTKIDADVYKIIEVMQKHADKIQEQINLLKERYMR